MTDKKIVELYFTKHDAGETFAIDDIYILYSDGYAVKAKFFDENYDEVATEYLSELTGITIDTKEKAAEAIAKAIKEHGDKFGVYEKPKNDKEIEVLDKRFKDLMDEWLKKNPHPVPVVSVKGDEIPRDNPVDPNDDVWVHRAIVGGTAAALLIGGLVMFHSCQQDDEMTQQEQQQNIELTEAQKKFFDSCTNFANNFNGLTTKDGNFKLAADGDIELKMSFAEAVALNISINDYSAEEIYELFGISGLDAENLTALRNSAYEKLTAYYMNAKEPSGVADMIRDEDARIFYVSQENAVLAFNANPSQDLANVFVNTTYNNYLNVKQGDSVEMKESLILGEGTSAMSKSAYMASTTVQGYMLANRNVDEYLKSTDTNITLTSLKTEKDGVATKVGVMDIINSANLCNDLNESLENLIDDYNEKVANITASEQSMLLSKLSDEAADIIREKGYGQDVLQEVAGISNDDSDAVNEYNNNMSIYNSRGAEIQNYIKESNEKVGDTKQTDVAKLINNRFRTSEKDKENGGSSWKDEAPVVDEKTETETKHEETKVDKDDLTPEEEKDAEEQIKEEQRKEYEGNVPNEAANDASKYATTKGDYEYKGGKLYDANGDEVSLEGRDLYSIAYMVAAYSDGEITAEDAQILAQQAADVKSFEEKLAGLGISNSEELSKKYATAWNTTMDNLLDEATQKGNEEEKRVAEKLEALKKAQEEANKQLQQGEQSKGEAIMDDAMNDVGGTYVDETSKDSTGTPTGGSDNSNSSSDTSTDSSYDPETDQNYTGGGEVFYVDEEDLSKYFQSSTLVESNDNSYTKRP